MKTILFVPGYYGSTLLDIESKEKIWLSLGQAFFNKNSLAVPMKGVDVPGLRDLIPGEMLEQVSVFMAYGKVKSFLAKLAGEKDWQFKAIPYDWRKDPIEGIRLIGNAVAEAKQSDQDEVYLVGHSQGSWLCSYYLRYGTQDYFNGEIKKMETWEGLHKINKVVLATAPFRGTMGLLRNTFNGVPVGPNSTLQSPLVFAMNPSTYYLLPPKDSAVALNENLELIRLPLHHAEFWRDNNLGLFRRQHELSQSSKYAAFEFLKTHLARAQRLHELILAPAVNEVPKKPFYYFTGHGRATVERGIRYNDQYLYYPRHIKKMRPEVSSRVVNVDGDGTLTSTSQALPPALMKLNPRIENIKMEHLELIHNSSSQKKIANFLLSGPSSEMSL